MIVAARSMPPDSFGVLLTFISTGLVLHAVFDMGISTLIIKERAENPHSEQIAGYLKCLGLILLVSSILLAVTIEFLGVAFELPSTELLPLAIWFFFEKMADAKLCIAQADGNNRYVALSLVCRRLVSIAALLTLLWSGLDSVAAFCVSVAGASTLSYILLWAAKETRVVGPHRASLKEVVQKSKFYWRHSLSVQVRNVDVAIVTIISGGIAGAYFGLANRLVSPLSMIPNAMASVLLPAVSKRELDKPAFVRLANRCAAATSVPLLLLVAGAPYLVPLLLGEAYRPAIVIVQVVAGSLAISSLSTMLMAVLQGMGCARKASHISIKITSLYLVLLVPVSYLGPVAAACLLGTTFLFRLYLVKREINKIH